MLFSHISQFGIKIKTLVTISIRIVWGDVDRFQGNYSYNYSNYSYNAVPKIYPEQYTG